MNTSDVEAVVDSTGCRVHGNHVGQVGGVTVVLASSGSLVASVCEEKGGKKKHRKDQELGAVTSHVARNARSTLADISTSGIDRVISNSACNTRAGA